METVSPESVGMSAARLARIGPVMQNFVNNNQLPGLLTLVQRRGQIVHYGSYGMMDIESERPMQPDAIFRIYSMTKPIVSVAIMMLLEEGYFSLGDPLSKFIPAFKETKVYDGLTGFGPKLVAPDRPITLHHLLTHTAGLGYGLFVDHPIEDIFRQKIMTIFKRDRPLEEVVDAIAGVPLAYQPGTRWYYSVAVDVLGRVIEVVSGQSLGDFLRERIFKPLGMVDTDFYVHSDNLSRLATLYTSKTLYNPFPLQAEHGPLVGDVTIPTRAPSGGGGLTSTLSDYLKFCECLLNGGTYPGGQLLGPKTITWMTVNHIPESMPPLKLGAFDMDVGFGLGFSVATSLGQVRTLKSVGEFGWGGLANTFFWVDRAEQIIGLMMTQHIPVDPYPLTDIFHNLVGQAIAE